MNDILNAFGMMALIVGIIAINFLPVIGIVFVLKWLLKEVK